MSVVYKTLTKMAAICDIFVLATGQLGRLLRTLRCDREEVNPKILDRFRRSISQQIVAFVRAVRYGVSVSVLATSVMILLCDLWFILALFAIKNDACVVVC